jgi:hypothetical protein
MALALMAQSTTQTTPAPTTDNKACACCNHDTADGKAASCGKDCCAKGADGKAATCCEGKGGKACPMASKDKDGTMACCAGGKCPMMSKSKDGKGCCGGKMCDRPQAGA